MLQIKKGTYDLNSKEWNYVSKKAKNLI